MKKENANRSSLLLMEIILAILFFSVISAVCVQIFVKSHTLSQDTNALSSAVNEASSTADILSTSGNPAEELQKFYPEIEEKNDGLYIYYDKAFQQCKKEDSFYHMVIILSKQKEGLSTWNIRVLTRASEESIYSLNITSYQQTKL